MYQKHGILDIHIQLRAFEEEGGIHINSGVLVQPLSVLYYFPSISSDAFFSDPGQRGVLYTTKIGVRAWLYSLALGDVNTSLSPYGD
jgi:hypothetical protein